MKGSIILYNHQPARLDLPNSRQQPALRASRLPRWPAHLPGPRRPSGAWRFGDRDPDPSPGAIYHLYSTYIYIYNLYIYIVYTLYMYICIYLYLYTLYTFWGDDGMVFSGRTIMNHPHHPHGLSRTGRYLRAAARHVQPSSPSTPNFNSNFALTMAIFTSFQ